MYPLDVMYFKAKLMNLTVLLYQCIVTFSSIPVVHRPLHTMSSGMYICVWHIQLFVPMSIQQTSPEYSINAISYILPANENILCHTFGGPILLLDLCTLNLDRDRSRKVCAEPHRGEEN